MKFDEFEGPNPIIEGIATYSNFSCVPFLIKTDMVRHWARMRDQKNRNILHLCAEGNRYTEVLEITKCMMQSSH